MKSSVPVSAELGRDWPEPSIRIGRTVEGTIGELVIEYKPSEIDHWIRCRDRWRRSRKPDYAVWKEYGELLQTGRNHFADREGDGPYGWPEAFVGLRLEAAGFTCWTGVQLFRRPGRGPISSPIKKTNTETVLALLEADGLPSPRHLQETVSFLPKNPDLVIYSRRRKEWRFAEVKRDEKIPVEQLGALALLHDGMKASVVIIRLVPRGRGDEARQHRFSFARSLHASV